MPARRRERRVERARDAELDVRGRRVRTLDAGPGLSGLVTWDGRDDGGRRVPSGVYLARFLADGRDGTRRFVYLAP